MGKVFKKEIREHLQNILVMTKGSISVRIFEIKNTYPELTSAVAAQVLANMKKEIELWNHNLKKQMTF